MQIGGGMNKNRGLTTGLDPFLQNGTTANKKDY